jgi:hypothetical protein
LHQSLAWNHQRRPVPEDRTGLLLMFSEVNIMRAQQSTFVGVFDDRLQADRAVDELRRAGFRDDQIGVAMRYDAGDATIGGTADAADADGTHAGSGAITGVLTGLGLGALAGFGVLSGVIPVIGPAIAGGTLGVILSNAAAGAGVGGLVGALVGAGIPEDEAHYYQGEFESGRTIVTVRADRRGDEAMAIFRRYGAYDMSTRPDYSAGTAATAANKPIDIPVRSEDVIGSGATADLGTGGAPDRDTGGTVL